METQDYTSIKRRIMKEGQLIKVQTCYGTAVAITKKVACRMIDILAQRQVEVNVSFTEMGNGKSLIIFEG